jgi:hypothetical protein
MHKCYYCPSEFEEYLDLAKHINSEHARKRNKWAATFVLKNVLFEKQKDEGRVPLTESEKEAKRSTQRELSGREKPVKILCPLCKSHGYMSIPIEHSTNSYAWHSNDSLMIICNSCRR